MSSRTKSETARANGAKSNGPVTPAGRAASSRNSLRHGLSSKAIVLPGESAPDFESLRDSYMQDFEPSSATETDLVEAMAIARWRLRRLYRIETEMFELEILDRKEEIDEEFAGISDSERVAWVFQGMANQEKCLTMLLRYEGTLTRSYDRAFKQLQILQAARTRREAPPKARAQQNEPKPAHADRSPDPANPPADPLVHPDAAPAPSVSSKPPASVTSPQKSSSTLASVSPTPPML